jgi:hypothetical protein
MNKTKVTGLNRKKTDTKWQHCLKRIGPLLPLIWVAAGCATADVKPVYPAPEAGAPVSILKLDNTMADSAWALQVKTAIGLIVTVDGFSPIEKAKLKSGQLGASKQLLPTGISEIRLPAGSHTLTHTAKVLAKKPYHFDPVSISFDTEAGRTYVVRFKNTTTLLKLCYSVEYEGWSSEQTSQWPNEVRQANPLGR